MFRLTSDPIEPESMNADAAGGFVTFDGRVRNHNEGKPVLRLEYEAYGDLAVSEGRRIVDEAVRLFGLLDAKVVHRVGLLEIGDCAVWIGVAAAHRAEAFKACAFIIDEIKRRVPIWKKEHYAEGPSEWIGVSPSATSAEFYRRQMLMPEVGEEGQTKLGAARVLVVGAGGLGCAVIPYLAAAGIGRLGICDGDRVDPTNLHRQILFETADRGERKATLAAGFARRLNPHIEVVEHPAFLDNETAPDLLAQYDIVVDGTDRFAAKLLLNELCLKGGKTLVSASLHRFEGQILVVRPDSGGGCMRCLWPEEPYDGCVGTCAEDGVLGVVPGVLGCLQANEVLKCVLGLDALDRDLALVDLRRVEITKISRARRKSCPVCGEASKSERIDIPYEEAIARKLPFVDIRDPDEGPAPEILAARPVPKSRLSELDGPICLVCSHGYRSALAARELRAKGMEAYSLAGGISSLGGIA